MPKKNKMLRIVKVTNLIDARIDLSWTPHFVLKANRGSSE